MEIERICGAKLDPEGNLVERRWNRRLTVIVAAAVVLAVGTLGAELDPEGDLVERYWNRRSAVLEP
jgi:hypothetical protein